MSPREISSTIVHESTGKAKISLKLKPMTLANASAMTKKLAQKKAQHRAKENKENEAPTMSKLETMSSEEFGTALASVFHSPEMELSAT